MCKKYGLVFAGGGTRGAYQVGASRAIKEMRLNVKSVSGVSIGAINAALFINGDINKMESIYKTSTVDDIMIVSDKINKDIDILNYKNIIPLISEYVKDKGIDNTPLKNMIKKHLNINKIYRSRINYGLVTFNTDTLQEEWIYKKDVQKEELPKYIAASACYPIFKSEKINSSSYLDGGITENAPVNMMIKEGYKNIILIDIGIGLGTRNISHEPFVKVISPSSRLGGLFDFNKDLINRNIMMGYLDTKKSFNKLVGNYYYFTKWEFKKLLKEYTLEEIYGLEKAALIYEIDRYKVIGKKEFINNLLELFLTQYKEYLTIKKNLSILEIKELLNKKMGICIAVDILLHYPSLYNNLVIKTLLKDYFKAATAIVSLLNKKRIRFN